MRLMAVLVVAGVCCAAAMGATSGRQGSDSAATAQSMYKAAEVVGVLLAADEMYKAHDVSWYSGRLRVDEVPASSDPKVGQVLGVRYGVAARGKAAQAGDQVRASIVQQPVSEGQAPVWVAREALTVLGRGDFVRPGEGAVTDLGSPKARILVKMLAPLQPECHQKTADLLKEFASREQERVRVQVFDMATPAGRNEMRREGLRCATVLVNNRYVFTLVEPEGSREVVLNHRPNSARSSYRSEDVIAVVEQEIKRLYPE